MNADISTTTVQESPLLSPIPEDRSPSPVGSANPSDVDYSDYDLNIESRSDVQIEIPRPATPANELNARVSEMVSETAETRSESQPLSRTNSQSIVAELVVPEQVVAQPIVVESVVAEPVVVDAIPHQEEEIRAEKDARPQDDAKNPFAVLISDLVRNTDSSISAIDAYGNGLRQQVQRCMSKIESCQKIIEDCQTVASHAKQILEDPI
ncbi:MAG: hypothetical protein LBK24_02045 [Puniceicoccales bacterium]|nr:hypothetical protein [Puniceicoccales bacterium]